MERLLWRLTRHRAAVAFYRAARHSWMGQLVRVPVLKPLIERKHYAGMVWSADDVDSMRGYLARPDAVIPVSDTYPHYNPYAYRSRAAVRPIRRRRWPSAQWVRV